MARDAEGRDLIRAAEQLIVLRAPRDLIRTTLVWARRMSAIKEVAFLSQEDKGYAAYTLRGDHELQRDWHERQGEFDFGIHDGLRISGDDLRIPLVFGKREWGELLLRGSANALTPECRDQLAALGRLAARAFRNAFVYDRLRARVKSVTALWKVGTTISSSLNLQYLLELILSLLREVVPYDAGGIYLLDRDGERLTAATLRGYRSEKEKVARAKVGQGLIGWATKQGDDLLVDDVAANPHYIVAREETRSEMVALIRRGSRIVGAVNVESDEPHAYSRIDLFHLKALASQAAIAVDNAMLYRDALEKRQLDSELSLARDIQQKLLPREAPRLRGWEMAGLNVPAKRVGGDYFDFIEVSRGIMGISIADVSGKGIPAGLVMATFRASLLAEILNEYSIEGIFRKVNELLVRSTEPAVFVTAIYGTLELGSGVFTYCNAGHVEPLIIRQGEAPRFVSGGDIVLGSFPQARYRQRLVTLEHGDVLLLYTDGISEAMGRGGEEFGSARLASLVEDHRELPAVGIRDRIYAEVMEFAADPTVLDDMTAVVVKRAGERTKVTVHGLKGS